MKPPKSSSLTSPTRRLTKQPMHSNPQIVGLLNNFFKKMGYFNVTKLKELKEAQGDKPSYPDFSPTFSPQGQALELGAGISSFKRAGKLCPFIPVASPV